MIKLASCVSILMFAGSLAATAQDDVPDFTGTWKGSYQVVSVDRQSGGEGKITEVAVTYELTGQKERLLWGTVYTDPANRRPIALAFSMNNGTMVGSDSVGFHRFTVISMNRMESCFTDNGAAGVVVATCGIVDRQ